MRRRTIPTLLLLALTAPASTAGHPGDEGMPVATAAADGDDRD